MSQVWEESFKKYHKMWGDNPSKATCMAYDIFGDKLSSLLIPGFGYGRNARFFVDRGIDVVGIEISQTAIDLARESGMDLEIHHGSVVDMPFDAVKYDGVYSYCLLHLLDFDARQKFIGDCYNQLSVGGLMIFVVISPLSIDVNKHTFISKNYYSVTDDVNLYFYDEDAIKVDFQEFGLKQVFEIQENESLNVSIIVCEK